MRGGIKTGMRGAMIAVFCIFLWGCNTDADKKAGGDAPTPLPKGLALNLVEAKSRLSITSPDLPEGRPIPEAFSQYGANKTPRFIVANIPALTVAFALIMEDPDAPGEAPFVHWVVYNISLKEAAAGTIPTPSAFVGQNSGGSADYFGPRPPQGDPPHHYHFQIFALDKAIDLQPGATRDEVVKAFSRNVLAKADYVVEYGKP